MLSNHPFHINKQLFPAPPWHRQCWNPPAVIVPDLWTVPSSGLVSQHLLLKVKNYTRGCFPQSLKRTWSEWVAVNFGFVDVFLKILLWWIWFGFVCLLFAEGCCWVFPHIIQKFMLFPWTDVCVLPGLLVYLSLIKEYVQFQIRNGRRKLKKLNFFPKMSNKQAFRMQMFLSHPVEHH